MTVHRTEGRTARSARIPCSTATEPAMAVAESTTASQPVETSSGHAARKGVNGSISSAGSGVHT